MGNTDGDFTLLEWKNKYYEAADLLAETKAELDEFQIASKELEEELERELQRTESEKERLRLLSGKAEKECNEWKVGFDILQISQLLITMFFKDKFINLQTLHNSTTNSLQRDLDTCRRECHAVKVQMRELEMGNDNLERNERAVASTLAELENRYSRVLEEKIILEHELLDKANLEEALQRLKDELRGQPSRLCGSELESVFIRCK
jgi:chromosome segregation ATPase